MSFRSVQRKNSILRSRKEDDSNEKKIEESILKLKDEANESLPFHTRKMTRTIMNGEGSQCSSLKNQTRPGFDFTEIFDELSALSKDISKCLEDDDEKKEKIVGSSKKDVSLRQMAFRNNAKTKDVGNPEIVGKSERLKDIRTLDAKLALIRDDLQGTAH